MSVLARLQAAALALAVAAGAVASECDLARCAMSPGLRSGRCCCGEGTPDVALRPACCESLRVEAAPALPDHRSAGGAAAAPLGVASALPQAPALPAPALASAAPLGARGAAPPLVILHRALLL